MTKSMEDVVRALLSGAQDDQLLKMLAELENSEYKVVEEAKEKLRLAGYSQIMTAAQIKKIVNSLLRTKVVGRRTLLSILRKT